MPDRKVVTLDGSGRITIGEEVCPEPRAGELLVEVKASLISPGTELGGVPSLRAEPDPARPPHPFGYSNAGIVIKQGSGCEDIPLGSRVACMGSGYALHANFACVPRNLSVPLPDSVSFEQGSFVHLAATALQAIRRSRVAIGEHFIVVGLGIVGQLCGQLAHIGGAHVMGWDRLPPRLEIAKKCGIEAVVNVEIEDAVLCAGNFARGYGIDCGIIAFGGDGTEAFKMIIKTLKQTPDGHKMGRVVIVGGAEIRHRFAAALGNVDVLSSARTGPGYHDEAYEHGENYPSVFVQWTTRRNLEEVVRWAEEGRLRLDPLITHRFPLEQAAQACEILIQHPDQALGVILKC